MITPPHQKPSDCDTDLSIIIVSFNTKDVTDACLASIYKAKWRSTYEVIVVDNNSHDGSVEMIREKYPQVKLIANPDNKYFAIANNQGAKIARGKYLLLLNSDTIVEDDNIQRMIDYFNTLPTDVICIGPKVLNPDKTVQSFGNPNGGYRERTAACFKFNRIFPEWFTVHVFGLKGLPYNPNKNRECGWVSGAAMMIRTDLYNKVGGLNDRVEFFGEEPEFGHRTHALGYRTLYYSGAEIIHFGGVSSKKNSNPTKVRHRRYGKLIKETVGYTKGIRMSKIVIFAAYVKRILSSDKEYFTKAIAYEKEVVNYLKELKNEDPV